MMYKNARSYSPGKTASSMNAPIYAGLCCCPDLATPLMDAQTQPPSPATLLFPRRILAVLRSKLALLRGERAVRTIIAQRASALGSMPKTDPAAISMLISAFNGQTPQDLCSPQDLGALLALLYFLDGEGCQADIEFIDSTAGRKSKACLHLPDQPSPAATDGTPHRHDEVRRDDNMSVRPRAGRQCATYGKSRDLQPNVI
ncbi:hypothetical protein [Martelella sp. HB161492]|uniref:hypothetical protein n=1 Tax=Martelella sp. HB161492 TaxID=2720726 RepID=UPI0015915A2A|nr:hypothetical protein [Martelella sp. HB161492]